MSALCQKRTLGQDLDRFVALGWLSGAKKLHRCRRRLIRSHHCGTALGRSNMSNTLVFLDCLEIDG
jgi:hypothetical protein